MSAFVSHRKGGAQMEKKEKKARSRELRLILLAELFRFLSDQQQEEVIEKIKSLLSDG
jgi:uncharacterized protein YeeX (DUF496 family)